MTMNCCSLLLHENKCITTKDLYDLIKAGTDANVVYSVSERG